MVGHERVGEAACGVGTSEAWIYTRSPTRNGEAPII